ncbi:hypothetical protein DERF_008472, partial [Dermatophagoides farinae]
MITNVFTYSIVDNIDLAFDLITTNISTGNRSSADGILFWLVLNNVIICEQHRYMHWILSLGVLYADSSNNSACADGHGL